jgi:hypothetical protein
MPATASNSTENARWLTLASSPTFALMALISTINAPPQSMCATGTFFLPVDGMTMMYLLMTLFHLPPWLKLAGHRSLTNR